MNAYLKKKTTLREKKMRLKRFMYSVSFRVSILFCVFVFSFFYIWQTNSVSTKGYEMSELEENIQDLRRENREIEVRIAENTSMEAIQRRLKSMNLVPAGKIVYLVQSKPSVAQR
ncbi:MAG: hypothetical protein HYY51_03515 [Candidatus Magasanikbacteria bacterium]|nr:hypothetical protein [Candidatus Magasanikbacteria bacterium]